MQKIKSCFRAIDSDNKFTYFLLIAIVASFITWESKELTEVETFQDYTDNVLPYLQTCDTEPLQHTRGVFKWLEICASYHWLGNERILPFVFSIVLLPITFLFAKTLTKKNSAGLIAVAILVSSNTFLLFDTTSTYEQSWVVFLLVSFILAWRGFVILPILVFILAILAKPGLYFKTH